MDMMAKSFHVEWEGVRSSLWFSSTNCLIQFYDSLLCLSIIVYYLSIIVYYLSIIVQYLSVIVYAL